MTQPKETNMKTRIRTKLFTSFPFTGRMYVQLSTIVNDHKCVYPAVATGDSIATNGLNQNKGTATFLISDTVEAVVCFEGDKPPTMYLRPRARGR